MKYFKHFDQEWQKLMFQNVMPELMVLLSVEQYDMDRRQMVMMNGHRASRFDFINKFQIPEAFVNELFDFCEEIRTEKYCRSIIAILAALTLFSSDRGYPKELDNGKNYQGNIKILNPNPGENSKFGTITERCVI